VDVFPTVGAAVIPFVNVSSGLLQQDMRGVKEFYSESTVQPFFFDGPPPLYAAMLSELIASLKPSSVLEFGCCAGRNLNLLRQRLPQAQLVGMDLNRTAIDAGLRAFHLDLRVADETALAHIRNSSFDISFTVSVLDHIALPQQTIARLTDITQRFIITYEICHDKTGKIDAMQDADGKIIDGYPFSYFHDYRNLFANAGCWLLLDAAVPAFPGSLGEFYRLQVHSKQQAFGSTILRHVSAADSSRTPLTRALNALRHPASTIKRLLSRLKP
jgi:SAM-dependent methyltransferase